MSASALSSLHLSSSFNHEGLALAATCEGRRGVVGLAYADLSTSTVRLWTFFDEASSRLLDLIVALSPAQVLLCDTHVAKGSVLTRRVLASASSESGYETVEVARRFWQEKVGADLVGMSRSS